MKGAFFSDNPGRLDYVYARARRQRVAERVDLYPEIVSCENFERHVDSLQDLEVIFSTWGMTPLSDEQVARLPALKAVFYAAGSVQRFARPFLSRGVTVVSAWAANAIPVAEFTLAQILLGSKGYFADVACCRVNGWKGQRPHPAPGVFGETVGLIGAGMIGRKVIELLKPFNLKIIVFDPFLPDETADALGVRKTSLEDLFASAQTVSNHLANNEQTRGMLTGPLFASMRPNATLINTARPAQIVAPELLAVLRERPDLTALLDLRFEDEDVNAQLCALPNCWPTSHIAGSQNDEVIRMADYALEEFDAWRAGRPLRYAVTMEMLETMA